MIDKDHFRLIFSNIGSVLFERLFERLSVSTGAFSTADGTSFQAYQFEGDFGAAVAG